MGRCTGTMPVVETRTPPSDVASVSSCLESLRLVMHNAWSVLYSEYQRFEVKIEGRSDGAQ